MSKINKQKQKHSKARHTCVTCSDKKTCTHPDYLEKVSLLIKEKYFKGELIVCNKWRRNPDKKEFEKWRFDENVRFGRRSLQPPYFELIGKDPEFTEWAYKLSKKSYEVSEEDLMVLNKKIKDIRLRYELFKNKPILRYQALSNFSAYCYAVLLDEYINKILAIRPCLECGRPTKNPKYCSNKCGNRARIRKHRSIS